MTNYIEKTVDLLNRNEYKIKMEKEPVALPKTKSINDNIYQL